MSRSDLALNTLVVTSERLGDACENLLKIIRLQSRVIRSYLADSKEVEQIIDLAEYLVDVQDDVQDDVVSEVSEPVSVLADDDLVADATDAVAEEDDVVEDDGVELDTVDQDDEDSDEGEQTVDIEIQPKSQFSPE